jgi:NADPH-dependent ferric siderophore reductase
MEISLLRKIKDKAGKLIESQLLHLGRVLEVRQWPNSELTEIDLHLPGINMQDWNQVPYIKIRVDDFSFRDYTPFGWDAETSICSILIDSKHQGLGSRWAQNLKTEDAVYYFRPESTRQAPHPTDCVVGLGDASSVGHMLALQQLTVPVGRFESAVILDNPETGSLMRDYFSPALNALPNFDEMANWLSNQNYCTAHTSFYINGNQQLVVALRKLLRKMGHTQIRVKSFWS